MTKWLVAIALATVGAAGLTWNCAGWMVPAADAAPVVMHADPFASPAAARHFNCQPNHWRAYVLAH